MSFAEKYNRKSLFTVDTNDFEYTSLRNLYKDGGSSKVYRLRGAYISSAGKFGQAPVFITDTCFVNMPKHLLDSCIDILGDSENISLINNGYVGFTIREYVDKTYNKICYTVDFVDIEPTYDVESTDDLPF